MERRIVFGRGVPSRRGRMNRGQRGLLAAVALLLLAPTAQAAVPRSVLLAQQVASLRSGTAILEYSPSRKPSRAALRGAGVRAVYFRKLPFVAVRGTAVHLRSAAGLRGIVAAHMDRRDALQLH